MVEYAYDAAARVTGITYKQGQTVLGNLTYEYDKAGNRSKIRGSFARTGVPQSLNSTNYNAANQQTTFGDKTLTYDNNGNLTSIVDANGTTLYTWNTRNQLVGISGPNVNASFVYDGLGRREKKTINGNLTEFLYDGINPVQETSGATILANILTGLGIDEFLARTDVPAGTTSSLLTDALGSAIALADSGGAVQTEYTYEPFGKTTTTGVSNTNPFQYTGRENDGTGLYYYRARYYEPSLQRFTSEDPVLSAGNPDIPYLVPFSLNEPQALHPYAYVKNTPINLTDPLGLVAAETTAIGACLANPACAAAMTGAAAAAICMATPGCRNFINCAAQLLADLAMCVGEGLCPGAKQEDTEQCFRRAWNNYRACIRGWPRPHPSPYPR